MTISSARIQLPALLLAALAVAACGGGEANSERDAGPRVVPVVVTGPELRSLDDVFLEREATLLPVAEATISTRQEGFVRVMVPEVGDVVLEGDLLAELDPTASRLQLKELRASLDKAETELTVQRSAGERYKKLHAKKVISEGEIEEQLAAVMRARSTVEEARSRVTRAENDLAELRITAPMPGVIVELFTEVGEYLERGDRLTRLKRIDTMVALCTVNERFLSRIREGAPVRVEVTAYPDRVFEGLVWKIVGDAVVESRSFPIKVLLPNPDYALKPGMSARVAFSQTLNEAVLVPKDAVLDSDRDPHVFVVADDRAERREVELGASIDDRWHVRSGLGREDRVIVTGNEDLDAGSSVKVVELPPAGPPSLPQTRRAERRSRTGS